MRRRVIAVTAVASLLAAGTATAKPRTFTKSCQVPAGKSVLCTLKLPASKKYRSARYDLGYTVSRGEVPGQAAPDLRLVKATLVSSGRNRRFAVRVQNTNAAGTAPALISLRAAVKSLR